MAEHKWEPDNVIHEDENCMVVLSTKYGKEHPMILISDKAKKVTYWINTGVLVIEGIK